MKEENFQIVEIEKLHDKIYIQCTKSVFRLNSYYIDSLSIVSPFETIICNVKAEIIVDNKKIKEFQTEIKFNQEYSYDFYDANFSYIVSLDEYLEWVCQYIDDLLFVRTGEYYSEFKKFEDSSNIVYKIDILSIEIDRKIENNLLNKWKDIIKNTYYEMEVDNIIDDIDFIKENYREKLLDKNKHKYIAQEEYEILNKIELAAKNRKEIILKVNYFRELIKEIKFNAKNSKNVIIIKLHHNESTLKSVYKLRDIEISLSAKYLTIKNKYSNELYKQESNNIDFKIKFDEEKLKVSKHCDDCNNKVITVKDDNIEIKVILNQE